jgi:hypothetical protein
VLATEHDDLEAGALPSPAARTPHQSPLGSIATHGRPLSYISSAITTAALDLPAPRLARMANVSVIGVDGRSRSGLMCSSPLAAHRQEQQADRHPEQDRRDEQRAPLGEKALHAGVRAR